MQRLSQSLKLIQKLSPQQIQLMKLLQVPTLLLDERIKEEIEENPALEFGNENQEEKPLNEKTNEELKDEFPTDNNEDYINDNSDDEFEQFEISDYVKEGDDEDADYNFQSDTYNTDGEEKVGYQHRLEITFYDHLMAQVNMLHLEANKMKIAEFIIGSIDDDGYLRRDLSSIVDDLAFRLNISTNENEILEVLKYIHEFDPSGVGARDLKECLLLQLRKKRDSELDTEKEKLIENAIRVLEKYFEEFTKKHYEKIQKGLNLSSDEIKQIIQLIIKLNPKPGSLYASDNQAELYVLPDFFVENENGELKVFLNQKNAPDLRVSSQFREMLRDYDKGKRKDNKQKEAILFIKQKIDSAKWFIDAVKQRQTTLLITMERIVQLQQDFFLTGDETALKPMILKDVADRVGLDISTVSRVVNSKYVQTEFGTYILKFFFSESMTKESGEEVSTKEVKKILQQIIEEEDKKNPHSDEKLTELLLEKEYPIARRTVAKYREQMNIPVARLRKEI